MTRTNLLLYIFSPVTEFTTSEPEQFVRVFKQGSNNPEGEFIVKASDINGLTPSEIKNKLALDNVPQNTSIRTGEARAIQEYLTNGGCNQFELLEVIDSNNFINPRSL